MVSTEISLLAEQLFVFGGLLVPGLALDWYCDRRADYFAGLNVVVLFEGMSVTTGNFLSFAIG